MVHNLIYGLSLLLVVPLPFFFQVLLVALLQHGILFRKILQLEGQGHDADEQFIVDFVLLVIWFKVLDVEEEFVFVHLDAHVLQDCLQAQLGDDLLFGYCYVELLLELHQFSSGVELIERDVLGAIEGAVLADFLDGLLEDCCWVFEADLIERGKDVWVCEVFFSFNFDGCWILHLRIDTSLRCIIDPLPDKDLILLAEEIRSLAFTFIIDPMPFEMISASLGQDSISASLAHVPHALVDIAIRVDHPSFAMRLAIHPHAIVSITVLIEHGPSALLGIIFPIASVLPSQLIFGIGHPEGALPMSFILAPSALILIPIGVILYPEAIFLVVLPVTDVFV